MLTKPHHGWSDFSLEGTSVYGLSYLSDIAFEWIDAAIFGLKNQSPFCVKGYLEPDRLLCVVSLYNCHIIIEDEDSGCMEKKDIVYEYSHTNMLEFCRQLYDDISSCTDEWASFSDYREEHTEENKKALTLKLEELKELITEKEKFFGEGYCFF
ncbi:MAG: hypothetical protein ACI4RH_06190 [Huintestinicola sp.]